MPGLIQEPSDSPRWRGCDSLVQYFWTLFKIEREDTDFYLAVTTEFQASAVTQSAVNVAKHSASMEMLSLRTDLVGGTPCVLCRSATWRQVLLHSYIG